MVVLISRFFEFDQCSLKTFHFFTALCCIFMNNTFAVDKSDIEKIFNVKNFSGAIMGMGLSKSYQQGSKKICIYNTINGQDKLVFKNNKVECPVEYPERKKK